MKKLALILLIVCLLPLAGLAEGEPWRGDKSNMPITPEKTELTVWITVPADVEDMNTNYMTQWYEDMTNIHVNWITATTSDSAQLLTLSLTSGEYPDIYMTGLSVDQIVTYGMGEGVLIPLEDLIEQYAPNMRQVFEIAPEVKELITAPDGHIYTFYRKDDMRTQIPFAKLWMNLPWLAQYTEATGKGMPETLDEFRDVLVYFRDHDMNGNGDATDEIPLLGTFSWDHQGSDPLYWIMNCFTYFPMELTYVKDGKAAFAPQGEDYREGLKYVRQLVVDGLLDELTYTQDLNQYRAVVNATSADSMVVGVAAAPYYMRFVTDSVYYGDAASDFFVIPPVSGPTGLRQTPSQSTGGMNNWAITKACKDPVAAIKWIDYLTCREIALWTNYGDEGTDWEATGEYDEVNGPTFRRLVKNALYKNNPGASSQNLRWSGWLSKIFLPGIYTTWTEEMEEGTLAANQIKAGEIYRQYAVEDGRPVIIWCTDEDLILEQSELNTQISDYAANMWTQFILGTLDINDDAQWAAYEQGLKDNGLDRFLEVLNEYWGLND